MSGQDDLVTNAGPDGTGSITTRTFATAGMNIQPPAATMKPNFRERLDKDMIPINHLAGHPPPGGAPIGNRNQPHFPSTSPKVDDIPVMSVPYINGIIHDPETSLAAKVHKVAASATYVEDHGDNVCPKNQLHNAPATILFTVGPDLPNGSLNHDDDPTIPPSTQPANDKIKALEEEIDSAVSNTQGPGRAGGDPSERSRLENKGSTTAYVAMQSVDECKQIVEQLKHDTETYVAALNNKTDAGIKRMEQAVEMGLRKLEERKDTDIVQAVIEFLNGNGNNFDTDTVMEGMNAISRVRLFGASTRTTDAKSSSLDRAHNTRLPTVSLTSPSTDTTTIEEYQEFVHAGAHLTEIISARDMSHAYADSEEPKDVRAGMRAALERKTKRDAKQAEVGGDDGRETKKFSR